MSIFARKTINEQYAFVEPKAVPTRAANLNIGDIIELPMIQRLVVKDITLASDGAVVIGTQMLVLHTEGSNGVFNKKEAAPIVIPANANVNLVSRAPALPLPVAAKEASASAYGLYGEKVNSYKSNPEPDQSQYSGDYTGYSSPLK